MTNFRDDPHQAYRSAGLLRSRRGSPCRLPPRHRVFAYAPSDAGIPRCHLASCHLVSGYGLVPL